MYLLITPSEKNRPFQTVSPTGKRPVGIETFPRPVRVDGIPHIGLPHIPAFAMSDLPAGGAEAYSFLFELFKRPVIAGRSVRRQWLEMAERTGFKGALTVVLLSTKGHVYLHTFDTRQWIRPVRFTEPVLFQGGGYLTESAVVEQLEQAQQERLAKVRGGFDSTSNAGLDLRLL